MKLKFETIFEKIKFQKVFIIIKIMNKPQAGCRLKGGV
jgi:hypothetical protein